MKPASKPNSVRITIRRADKLAFLGAAYLATEQASACVSHRRGGDWAVNLWPKAPSIVVESLGEAFRAAYDAQLGRWAIAKANKDLRAAILRRALVLAEQTSGQTVAGTGALSPEQKQEISRLLAEAESDTGPQDPLRIRENWEDLGAKKP